MAKQKAAGVRSAPAAQQPTPAVRDFMTAAPQTLDSDQSLLEAVLLLRSTGFRHIPIVEQSQLVGVLSDRDLWRYAPSMLLPTSAQEYNRVFEETKIGAVMTRNPTTTVPGATLREAAELMLQQKLGCLPILEEGRLVGILTMRDMARALHTLLPSSIA
jgi:acetoin utilization protein AcuB